MTIAILLILLLLAAFFAFKQYIKLSLILFGSLLILIELIGSGVMPYLLLKPLESNQQNGMFTDWKKENAIVVLGGGLAKTYDPLVIKPALFAYSRLYEAAVLYFSCHKNNRTCHIIISGGNPLKLGQSEAEVYKKTLLNLPINSADIITEAQSNNTYQNARFTSQILKQHQYDQVVMVTSGFHSRRALLLFKHFGINPVCWQSDKLTINVTAMPNALNFILTDLALHEYQGIVQFYLYHLF